MSHADRARRAGIRAERNSEKAAFDRAAHRQMMAEAYGSDSDDETPEQPRFTGKPARRPQGME